mmetsp:Transcript_44964/g.51983  ORF Transcript_44964/g.51983 Transcript_44964/m.51983 type:complete len:330 (-) Transcript_44964:154-1143(-)|eukprot:CAMPEP_0176430690 /NCGR_PEP_ID=MMETSP0127-20121128/14392_1 /TAXON_ID=938130 /ORGANISM="Platyophrya macrostoma, Strain WH" /LENGTH=329 /DNA_ID=CAMNT_0017812605 /DNA_START=37 /DNA_END=1026 /DNA_ORIENTATION=+
MNRIKAFDAHRKLPSDLSESTTLGAAIGIVAMIVMGFLFIYEIKEFMKTEEYSDMYIDVNRGGGKLVVNIDISLPRMPCDIVSLDQQDVMGTHTVNLAGDLHKVRTDERGNEIEVEKHSQDHDYGSNIDFERTRKAFQAKEGCILRGYILVNKVPGNFHISSHAYGHLLQEVFRQNGISTIDVSHRINHLSFGEEKDLTYVRKNFKQGVLNPLNGMQKVPKDVNTGTTYQYYLNIVPTTYQSTWHTLYVFQFSANGNEVNSGMLPALFFRYEISPNTIKFSQESIGFLHFLVQLSAIIGGVFTIASVVDSVLHKVFGKMLKKSSDVRLT